VAQKALRHQYAAGEEPSKARSPALNDSKQTAQDDPPKRHNRPVAPLRQFRLSPWPRSSHSNHPSGIQKRKTARKTYLATFVERSTTSRLGPRFLEKIGNNELGRAVQEGRVKRSVADQPAEKIVDAVPRQMLKAGQSMHDHPSTWDYDSDQLAEELAAFALDISQTEEQEKLRSKTSETHDVTIKETVMNLDGDFIYDTYIRVAVGDEKSGGETINDVGLLVIEDEDHELWQTFVESDDDSEWDEEDPDSNGLF
jgi:Transcription factor Iwr1